MAALLLSFPAAASDWENVLGFCGAGASVTGTGTVRDLEIDIDFDDLFDKVEMGDHVRMVVQDRAYTSPIWYTP